MYRGKYSAVIGWKTYSFVFVQYEYAGYGFLSQSQRCICPRTSNHGFSPNDSVNYKVVDPSQFPNFNVRGYTACVSVLLHEYLFTVQRLGPEVHDLTFRVCSSEFRVFRVRDLGFRV